MAGEDFQWEAIFEFTIKNAQLTVSQVDRIRQSMDKLAAAGKVTEDQYQSVDSVIKNGRKDLQARTSDIKSNESALIRQRYALYDVASTYGLLSAALLATAGYAVKTGADFESAFTNVERTLENGTIPSEVQAIRDELVNLSTTIPKTFEEIAQIATLGNQLGIAAEDLTSFTETVAQFSAVTGITAEASAQAFGRIGNILGLTSDDYDNLASAITYVGRTSAATEKQIITLTERLGASATRAGLTAQEVVGLSGAIASLAVAPERAQGVFETYFNRLNTAVAEGGDSLQNFAVISGKTASQVSEMVRSGQGLPLLLSILEGLGRKGDTVEVTAALESLGLTGLRAAEVMGRLADNTGAARQSIANSVKAYEEATEIGEQFAKINDDLNSEFKKLVNSVNALIESLSGGAVTSIADLVGALTDVVNATREFTDNDTARVFAGVIGLAAVATGLYLAFAAATALATASTFALTTAQTGLAAAGGSAGVVGMLRVLTPGLFTLVGAQAAATGSTVALTGATSASLLAIGGISPVAYAAATAVTVLGAALTAALPAAALATAGVLVGQLASTSLAATAGVGGLNEALKANVQLTGTEIVSALNYANTYLEDLADNAGMTAKEFAKLYDGNFLAPAGIQESIDEIKAADQQLAAIVQSGNPEAIADLQLRIGASGIDAANKLPLYTAALIRAKSAMAAFAAGVNSGPIAAFTFSADQAAASASGLGKSAGGAAPKIRTLVDYANDLSSVFSRAFDIRFGAQGAIDDVTSSFTDLADRIRDANTELLKLTANRSVKEYFLGVANAYGDTLRAGVLTGELAELNGKIADTQADASTELKGNSKAAIQNRKVITGLVSEYQDYITALAAGDADQATLNAAVAQSRNDFIAQATALGYSNAQLQPYIASFSDMAVAIGRIPRNITVTASTDPALQALNEFIAKARSAIGGGINIPITGTVNAGARDALFTQWATAAQKQYGMALAQSASGWATVRANWERGVYGQFATGGFTGRGGKYEPAGVVHRGEYVIPKSGVNQSTGLPYADALGRAQQGSRPSGNGYANGGYVNGGMGMGRSVVDLGAGTIQQLARAVQTQLLLDGRVLGVATSRQYATGTYLGSN